MESLPEGEYDGPEHYAPHVPGGLDCMGVIRNVIPPEGMKWSYVFNALKYVYRFERKNGAWDILKAIHYLCDLFTLLTGRKVRVIVERPEQEDQHGRSGE